jgi:hypothetical protein
MTDSHRRQNEIDDVAAVLVAAGVDTAGLVSRSNGRQRIGPMDDCEQLPEDLESALLQLLALYLSDDEWRGAADVETPTYRFGYLDVSSHADDIAMWQVYFAAKEIK